MNVADDSTFVITESTPTASNSNPAHSVSTPITLLLPITMGSLHRLQSEREMQFLQRPLLRLSSQEDLGTMYINDSIIAEKYKSVQQIKRGAWDM